MRPYPRRRPRGPERQPGLLRPSYRRLQRGFARSPILLKAHSTQIEETPMMTILSWTLAAMAAGVFAAMAAAGVYAESHRAPDQP